MANPQPVVEMNLQPKPDSMVPAAHQATAVIDRGHNLATSEVIQRTKQIREIMEKVMKANVHYGVIPGTQKPTLYQPGADILNVTFRIAPIVAVIDDLSVEDAVRYRITVLGEHQVTKETLAEGIGACSSNEEKYRWRKPVCDEEFNETPEHQRRNKWRKGQGGKAYKEKQIRTSPADVDNTILKMAVKRAKIAMTLSATGAADVFGQDLEDLAEELRETLAEEGVTQELPKAAPRVSQQTSSAASNATPQAASPAQPAAAQANGGQPPAAATPTAKPIGVITKVETHGNAIVMHLDSGFRCVTSEDDKIQAIGRLQDSKRRVELLTRPSAKGAKFLPVLTSIEFPVDSVDGEPAVQS